MATTRFSFLKALLALISIAVVWLLWEGQRLQDVQDDASVYSSPPPSPLSNNNNNNNNDSINNKSKDFSRSNLNGDRRSGTRDNPPDKEPEPEIPHLNPFWDNTIVHPPSSSSSSPSSSSSSPLENLQKPYTIVTAASSNHFCALESFLYSMSEVLDELQRTEHRPRLIVYNLGGMSPAQSKQLAYLKKNQFMDDYRDFDYQSNPPFWNISKARGEYGWKAGIIQQVAQESRGIVLWLDSGNMLALEFLRYLPGYLDKYGFWSPQSSGNFQQYTHPGLPAYYGDSIENYAQETNCNGAAVAFDASNDDIYNGLLQEWYMCSRTKACIAPKGSSRANHRQDQAALTYLVKRNGFSDQCRRFPEHYGVTVHQDKICRERIRAYKIMRGLEQSNDDLGEEDDHDD
ncbi:hypothetical protein BG004_004143 [Podila humilis]|nr:hypothetical protein BG004_004143 [Podila humilis]